jgi:hypothetical protein
VPEPDGSCHLAEPSGAGRSSVRIVNSTEDRKDGFTWKWTVGSATDVAAFKTPTTNDPTYRLCIYDGSGSAQPLLEADVPSGDGWRATSSGFKYKGTFRTTLSGITRVQLKAGTAGKAKVLVKGVGPLLYLPATETLAPDVIVQLLIDDGVTTECFKTAFPGPSGAGAVTSQDSTEFEAKGP